MRNRRVRRYSSVIFSGLLLFLGWVCIGEVSDAQRQEEVSQLFEILSAIYDNDTSLIPDEPNEIIALQSSADSRDQLAWELFNMMRQAMDPNYVPAVDVSAEQEAADVMEPVKLEAAAETMEVADSAPLAAIAESSSENGMMTMASASPPLREPNEPTAVFMQCPAGSSGSPRGEMDSFAGWSQRIAMLSDGGSEPNVIEINSDITTNQVWDANNVYYITDANGVDVQALLVIEPGVTVIMGYQCGLFVNNGGALITKGTPDKPIIFTPDYMYYNYPDYIGYYWQVLPFDGPYYYSPIYIQDTASPATTVRYCMIEGAIGGIVTDNIRLTNPIENNYLFGNIYGIFEFGPKMTDIRNNLCFYNDQAGIEAYLEPDPNALPDTENPLTIEQNTCDGSEYTYCGITIHGVSDPNALPTVYVLNNIVTGNYNYGLNLRDGAMYALVANTGYYDNGQNKSWEFEEYAPVIAEEFPYASVMGEKPYDHHYLAPDSTFIDAGSQYIEQTPFIGMTTNENSAPDKNLVDIGFHHMDWDYVGGEGIADTDIDDLITLSNCWLTYTPFDPNSPGYIDPNTIHYGGDWNHDGFVDLTDFAILAGQWQAASEIPQITASIHISSEDGSIEVQVQDEGAPIYQCFLLVDGVFVKELIFSDDIFQRTVYMPWLSPGLHEARIIGSGQQGIICSAVIPFEIDNAIGPCIVPQMFEMGEPLSFFASSDVNSIQVSAYSWDGCVWQETYSGGSICGTIPASATDSNEIEYLQFQSSSAGSHSMIVPLAATSKNEPNNIRGLIVLPDFKLNRTNSGLIGNYKRLFKNRGVPYKVLGFYSSSLENLKYYAQRYNIQYLIINAHGYWKIKEVNKPRTIIYLDDGRVISDKRSNYQYGAPGHLELLPDELERTLPTWREINFQNLRYVHVDACFSGHLYIDSAGQLVEGRPGQIGLFGMPHNDMSRALDLSSGDKIYFGWHKEFVGGYSSPYYQFSGNVIGTLEEGNNFPDSLNYAIRHSRGSGEQNPLDDFRALGQGDNIQGFRIN